MPFTNLQALVRKLNPVCTRALEGAAGLCMSRTNYNVEIEHWLLKLLDVANSDIARLFKHYDIDLAKVSRDIARVLDTLKTGNARAPELSQELTDWMREAWVLASLDFQANRVRSGHLLVALLTERTLSARAAKASTELVRLPVDKLKTEASAIMAGSSEDGTDQVGLGPSAEAAGGQRPATDSKTPALDQFTQDLTARAKAGKIDPVIGRDPEIRQVIDILTRRRQNNPILAGEAGVGKTAVVEGFAMRIASGDVPEPLKNVQLRTLDLGLLQAGAGMKGEFENRLKSVIEEVQRSPVPIILFIDEAHTLIGAGASPGSGDAANLLKPALARGELRTVAATTFAEYKKSFETDPALKRRFQMVKVDEPERAKAVAMLQGVAASLEKHHKVRILEEAMDEAVRLSARYVPDRQLPDKAVSVLDTACARVALSQSTTPPQIEDARRELELLDVDIRIRERESLTGIDHAQQLSELKERRAATQERLAALEKRLTEESALVAKIRPLRDKLESAEVAEGNKPALRQELLQLEKQLQAIQGENPLVLPLVGGQAVAEVIAAWTGIPLGKMVRDEIQTILGLKNRLAARVVGQDHALEAVAQRIQTSRARLDDPRRPIGVFMLVGPSGVGKTETAIALSDVLYGGDRNLVVINMSEYKEEHKVSRLTGSAPGYVGYGEGGVLTEAVRRKPSSIVLLDEVEKANPAVQEIFYQVFDKGVLQDDKGQDIDFKNTIILLTSNVATDTIMKLCADPETMPDEKGLAEAIRPDLLKVFKPALLGRIVVLPYFPLSDTVIKSIITLKLNQVRDRVKENYRAKFEYDDAVTQAIASRTKEVESGARAIDNLITGTLLPEVSREFLTRMAEGTPIESVRVLVKPDGNFGYEIQEGARR